MYVAEVIYDLLFHVFSGFLQKWMRGALVIMLKTFEYDDIS